MPGVRTLLRALAALAPPDLAEEWDNVGLLVGRASADAGLALAALDLRAEVLEEAAAAGAGVVLVHHPPLFPALASVTDAPGAEGLVLRAAELGVAVVAAHTNLDATRGGLNDIMASVLGLLEPVPLAPTEQSGCGLGRIGRVQPTNLAGMVERVRVAYPHAPVRWAGDPATPVSRVACCTGSGGSLAPDALAAGADCHVTSDLRYHDADRTPGLGLVDVPHGVVEGRALAAWVEATLAPVLAREGMEIRPALAGTDPWRA